jgi:Na+-driven multidrug efflux pump
MVANIILNYYLIPVFGIKGAAIATLISYSLSTLGIVLFKSSRSQVPLILKSFNPFSLRYLFK